MAWTAPRTWVAGEVVTAALMNTHVRDNLKAFGDPWTSYTPVLSSNGTQPATSTAQGGYILTGKWCQFWARMVISDGGTGTYEVTFPVTAARVYTPGICGHFLDVSAVVTYAITAVNFSTTEFRMAIGAGGFVGQTVPVTVGSTDQIVVGGAFETA